jgi:hypothetical protein
LGGLFSLSWPKIGRTINNQNEEKLVMRSIFLNLIAASFAVLAIPAFAAAQTTEVNVYLMSKLLNFTRGQAVSLNFTNVDRVERDARLYFIDANGHTLKTSAVRVVPGQSASLSILFTEVPRTSQTRVGVRGVVVLADPPDPDADPPQPDLSLANLEIYDVQTSKTTFGLLLPAVRSLNVFFPTDQ